MAHTRRILTGLTAALGTAAVLLTGCSTSTVAPDVPALRTLPAAVTEDVSAQLAATMKEFDVPGGAVRVCTPGYEDWTTAQGVADTSTGEPMSTELVWPLRSVTKSFTTTLLLQLVDEGKVSLDDPVSKYVAGVPNGDSITLAQLADMTSGVPEYTTEAWVKDYFADEQRTFTSEELVAYALAEPAQYKPGASAVYTNTNTLLIGAVVAEATGQPFADVIQERILSPLDLTDTTYLTTPDEWSGPHPTGYQPNDKGVLEEQGNNFTVLAEAGAMTSTLADMCAWGTALGSGELLNDETQAARLVGQPLDKGPEYDEYDLGVGELEGWVGHTGEGFGHTVLVMHNEETGMTVATGMNIAKASAHAPTRFFREIAPVLDTVPVV